MSLLHTRPLQTETSKLDEEAGQVLGLLDLSSHPSTLEAEAGGW